MLYYLCYTGSNSFGGGGRGAASTIGGGRPVGSNNSSFTLQHVLVRGALSIPPFTHQVCPKCPEDTQVQPWDSYLWDLKREVWVPVLSMCQKSGHAGCCTPHEPHESNVRYIGQTQAKRVFNGSKDAYRQWLTNRDSHSVTA
jgi:hypothetical protein